MIQQQLKNIQSLIEQAKQTPAHQVEIIAVTKQLSVEQTRIVLDAGLQHLGENRPQGFLPKVEAFGHEPVWHFIGSLQTRKVRDVIDHIDFLHSLDRMSLAQEIQKRATKPVKCFIQVNVSGEDSKHGLAVKDVQDFIEQVKPMDKIELVGLMTMAPLEASREEIKQQFHQLRLLRDELRENLGPEFKELSMGMSGDYELAVEEGATFVRIGTALVGSLKE